MNPALLALAGGATALACWLAWSPPPARALLGERHPDRGRRAELRAPTTPPSTRALHGGVAAVLLLLLVPGTTGVIAALVGGIVVHQLSGRRLAPQVRRVRAELAEQLPECLSLLAAALAAGSPLRRAVAEVAAISPRATQQLLDSVAGHIQVGRGEDEAWRAVAEDPVVGPVWAIAARDLARNAHSGAAVVDLLRRHAIEARAERSSQVEKQARTVGVQSVMPLMVCFLPGFVLVGVVPIIASLVGQLSW